VFGRFQGANVNRTQAKIFEKSPGILVQMPEHTVKP
jgi:hypothetical protein